MHVVLDAEFESELVEAAAAEWPAPDWPGWIVYDTPLEQKRACPDWQKIPPACAELLRQMLVLVPGAILPGAGEAAADVTLYGAGMHDMGPGGHLDLHLDADRHPLTGMDRRANAILFLEPWEPEWGGAFHLYDGERLKAVVPPQVGRLLIFETTDKSVHGVPLPLRCPAGVRRKSLAVYWWGLGAGASKRPRARFVAAPGEAPDAEKERLRVARAVRAAGPHECKMTDWLPTGNGYWAFGCGVCGKFAEV